MNTVQADAGEYVRLLNSTPDGLGQNVHPHYGASHVMLRTMYQRHGQATFNQAVDAIFKANRERHNANS